MPDEDELGHGGLEALANEAAFVDTLMGWDGDPEPMLCGCWAAINHGLDLREDPIHGTRGHDQHQGAVHGWCAICSPGSVPVIEQVFGER